MFKVRLGRAIFGLPCYFPRTVNGNYLYIRSTEKIIFFTYKMRSNSIKKSKSRAEIQVQVVLYKEQKAWIAYCPSLDLSSYGDSEKEAKEAFDEALEIFIEETTQRGTLEKFLLQHGWSLKQLPNLDYTPPVPDLNSLLGKAKTKVFNETMAIPV